MEALTVLTKSFILGSLIFSALCAIVLAVLSAVAGATAQVLLLSGAGVLLGLGVAACTWAVSDDESSVTTLASMHQRNARPR
jgi:hypothetical protein